MGNLKKKIDFRFVCFGLELRYLDVLGRNY